MSIKCIIVDDEPLAIEVVEGFVGKIESLELIGKFRNAIKAFDFVQNNHVDLIFLDIQMPKLNGIEFLKALSHKPKIIFTTAYREYAVEGFDLEVVDYLVKPISLKRFMKSISRISAMHVKPSVDPKAGRSIDTNEDFIFFKSDKTRVKVFLRDILFVESLKDRVRITTSEKKVLTNLKISYLENQLPTENFLRVHRSFIVTIQKIESYTASSIKIGEEDIPIGRNYKNDTLRRLESIVM